MKRIFKALYRRKWLFWSLLVLLVIVGFSLARSSSKKPPETVTVVKADLIQSVSATGTVKPKNSAALRFETDGTIAAMTADVGDKVWKGKFLARLNAGDLNQRVVEAEAGLKAAQMELFNAQEAQRDTGTENKEDLANAYSAAFTGWNDVFNLVQEAHIAEADLIEGLPFSEVRRLRDELQKIYQQLRTVFASITPLSTAAQLELALKDVAAPLATLQQLGLEVLRILNSIKDDSKTKEELREDQAKASAAQADINAAVAKIADFSNDIRDAKTSGTVSTNTSSASVRTAQAAVVTAQAKVSVARSALANAYLYAPISGTIASKSKNIGESVTAADQVYYIIGEGGLEITAYISEVDIAKVAVNNIAQVTLDAYGDEVPFEVKVQSIDPAETVVDGVTTYKVIFVFVMPDARVRSGMTANITISTEKKEQVLAIPLRAVHTQDGKKVVTVQDGSNTKEIEISTGLRGNNGMVEVTEGLSEGAVIVIETQ